MLIPYFTTYQQHFDYQVKEVAAKLRASEPERFISLVDHLRSVSCTALDFQKADMMLKVSITFLTILCYFDFCGEKISNNYSSLAEEISKTILARKKYTL